MDFPITERDAPVRHATGTPASHAAADDPIGSFADILSADMFSDFSENAASDEIYDEFETLTAREDRADDPSSYDDYPDDRAADDDNASDRPNRPPVDGDGNPAAVLAAIQQSVTSATPAGGLNAVDGANPAGTRSGGAPDNGANPATPQGQLNASLAGTGNVAANAANLAEARVMNKRLHTLQANAQHAETAKSQLAKAEGTAPDAAARSAGAAKSATASPDLAPSKTEASRLDQAFRATFPQSATAPATPTLAASTANPALTQTPLVPQNASIIDSLTSASASDGGETSTPIQNNAERASNLAASKAAATRSPFTLPGSRPAEQVSVQIQNAARNGTDRISIRLSPAALGNVEVKLELSPDKTVQAIVTAEKPETLDMLERDARTLQRALEEAGLRTNSDSLSFERRDPNGTADTASDSDGNTSNGTNESDPAEQDDGHGQIEVELSNRRRHDGLLDVEV